MARITLSSLSQLYPTLPASDLIGSTKLEAVQPRLDNSGNVQAGDGVEKGYQYTNIDDEKSIAVEPDNEDRPARTAAGGNPVCRRECFQVCSSIGKASLH